MLISAWNTRLHACSGCRAEAGDFFLLCPGLDSTESATKILATERTKRRMTVLASACLWVSPAVVCSCLIMVDSSVSSISAEHFTSRQCVNLSRRAVPTENRKRVNIVITENQVSDIRI